MGMRKGVPHAKCSPLCAIKEKLQELWDRAYGCINKINDITPDGDGKFKINAGSGIVVSPDGNGIEISAASVSYTGVDPIVVDNDTLEISAPTVATQDDLAAKADKATTLGGYGITDAVTLNTNQEITAVKTYTHSDAAVILKRNSSYSSGQAWSPYLEYRTDTGDASVGRLYARRDATNDAYMVMDIRDPGTNTWKGSINLATNGSDAWVTAPTRAYASGNTSDIVTIGSLAANPNVVHTVGNETISGYKTFTNDLSISEAYNPYFVTQTNNIPSRSAMSSAANYYTRWEWRAANGDMLGAIQFVHNANSNSTEIQVCSINNGSEYWRALQ